MKISKEPENTHMETINPAGTHDSSTVVDEVFDSIAVLAIKLNEDMMCKSDVLASASQV